MKQFDKKEFKKEIKEKYGSVAKFKKYLKETAEFKWGGYINEVVIYGCKVIYTSNTNCWSRFIVRLKYVGFCQEFALDKSSLTKRGKMICSKYLF